MMNFLNQHNLKAAAVHLAISAAIALLSLSIVYGLWYASPLDKALGVGRIFLMLLAIDLILGPLMTLVVYKPNKSSLTFDLTVIASLQLAALIYGMHTVGTARPAYLVFTKERFDLVQAHEVASISGTNTAPSFTLQSPWTQPLLGYQTVAANVPTGQENIPLLNALTMGAMSGGPDVANLLGLHAPYSTALKRIQATASPLSALKTANPIIQTQISALLAKYPANSLVSPLKIKFTIYTVVMNPDNASILGIEPIDVF
jgi:hypothetical protein